MDHRVSVVPSSSINVFYTAENIGGAAAAKSKDHEELDQVAGNAEDEIGERIQAMREQELLEGPQSLLAIFGPMLVHIVGTPPKFKVGSLRGWFNHLPWLNCLA